MDHRTKFKINGKVIDLSEKLAFDEVTHQSIPLDNKSTLLLKLLAEAGSSGVKRQQLTTTIWPDSIVSDDSLTNLVSLTRTQLKHIDCHIIKTVPRLGYKLVDEVTWLTFEQANLPINRFKKLKAQVATIKLIPTLVFSFLLIISSAFFWWNNTNNKSSQFDSTLAILAIDNFSQRADIQNIADSLTEEMTHHFASFQGLSIVSRTEASRKALKQYSISEIASQLDSRYLIEGSIREFKGRNDADNIRVTIQLIDSETGLHLFSRVFDAELNLFVVRKEQIIRILSRLVASEIPYTQVKQTLQANGDSLKERCNNYTEVATLYSDKVFTGIQSIALPAENACISWARTQTTNVLAQTSIATLYNIMAMASDDNRHQKQTYLYLAKKYLTIAQKMDPEALETYIAFIAVNTTLIKDALGSKQEPDEYFVENKQLLLAGLELYPFNYELWSFLGANYRSMGVLAMRTGKSPLVNFQLGEQAYQKAISIDPLNSKAYNNFARIYKALASYLIDQGDNPQDKFNAAILLYKKSINIDPKQPIVHMNLANIYSNLGKWQASHHKPYQSSFISAKQAYEKAINYSEAYANIYNNLADMISGLAKIKLNEGKDISLLIKEGLVNTAKAIAIRPDYVWPRFNAMTLHAMAARLEYAQGSSSIEQGNFCEYNGQQGLEYKNNLSDVYVDIVLCSQISTRILLETGHKKAALAKIKQQFYWLETALNINQNSANVYQAKANSQLLSFLVEAKNLTMLKAAENSLLRALEINPNNLSTNLDYIETVMTHIHYNLSNEHSIEQLPRLFLIVEKIIQSHKDEHSNNFQLQIFTDLLAGYRQNKLIISPKLLRELSKQNKLLSQKLQRQYQHLFQS